MRTVWKPRWWHYTLQAREAEYEVVSIALNEQVLGFLLADVFASKGRAPERHARRDDEPGLS